MERNCSQQLHGGTTHGSTVDAHCMQRRSSSSSALVRRALYAMGDVGSMVG